MTLKPKAITQRVLNGVLVSVVWTSSEIELDRPNSFGFLVRDQALAQRLARAVEAEAVFAAPTVCRDVHGQTYVSATSRVLVRTASADLRRLGF